MGQTRVDLLHLLEDLRDAYPGDLEETILTEIVANSLDSGARHLRVLADPSERTLVVVDDGRGMTRRELSRYHDVAASTKERGEGIGFAGVGIKLGLLVAEEVLTETRRGETHVATRWRLASRQRAPWNWTPPPGWVKEKGTAVGLRLKNPLSPLLDPGYVEAALRRHFEPLLDAAFDDALAEHYPAGVAFAVNGRLVEKRNAASGAGDRAPVEVRLPRKRKPAALGYVERFAEPVPEDRQGIAISTLGKVIRRGWDWLGVTCTSPSLVAGLVEAPALAAVLTLNKGDFVRAGRRGITYLGYRKAIQEAVSRPLAAWGEARDREDTARRRAARPLEKDLETVLVDLAEDYPALTALVERRAGGQRRLPTGKDGPLTAAAAAVGATTTPDEPRPEIDQSPERVETEATAEAPPGPPASAESPERPALEPSAAAQGPKRPSRYGLAIDFEDQPDRAELGRLVESTVWVNTAHPAYGRAVASRADGYHVALTVGLSLAPLAAEPGRSQEFLTEFLARWGESLGRDRRRRRGRPR
jgi:Histidine kinase-, DNA gyrase B-, and HSP90-like ATPase